MVPSRVQHGLLASLDGQLFGPFQSVQLVLECKPEMAGIEIQVAVHACQRFLQFGRCLRVPAAAHDVECVQADVDGGIFVGGEDVFDFHQLRGVLVAIGFGEMAQCFHCGPPCAGRAAGNFRAQAFTFDGIGRRRGWRRHGGAGMAAGKRANGKGNGDGQAGQQPAREPRKVARLAQ